jgi:hypothetical protein
MTAHAEMARPKGNRPLPVRPHIVYLHTHAFVPQTLDPVSCVRCALPKGNSRHVPPPAGEAA